MERRQRELESLQILDAASGATLVPHEDLWFEDGSVLFRAEEILFKVHMSLLARHSAFFKDMFAMPQPQTKQECKLAFRGPSRVSAQLQSIPFIELQDAAEDVGNLFTALYDGPKFGNNDIDDFRVVSGVLRLSTKYLIDSLRSTALAHLHIAWPTTLEAWDAREDLARSYERETGDYSHRYPHPIAVVKLAREVNALSLLPAAFYDLSRYPYSHIFDVPADEQSEHPPGLPTPSSPSTSLTLSMMDVQRLCLGKEAVQHMITTLITSMGQVRPATSMLLLSSVNGGHVRPAQPFALAHSRRSSFAGVCVTAAACRKDFSELVDLATQHYLFDRERGYCDPLYVAEELGQLKSAEFSECKACARTLECWAAREREKIWKSIPTWFKLDSWESTWDGHWHSIAGDVESVEMKSPVH